MTETRDPPQLDGTLVLVERPETVLLQRGAAMVAIHRAQHDSDGLAALRRSWDAAALTHPKGVVILSAYRLSPEFPLRPGFDTELGEIAETLRAFDRALYAVGTVLEFGGVRAAAMRAATRAVWSLVRPRAALGQFDRLSEAISWLLPHAEAVGAPTDPGTYVRLYREADRRLEEMDAARALRRGRPPGTP